MIDRQYDRHTVFYGHGIADPMAAPEISAERTTNVAPADLDALLACLEPSKHALTLDDGYANNMTTALPILEHHERPATIFVTTGFVTREVVPTERIAALLAQDDHRGQYHGLYCPEGTAHDRYRRIHAQLKACTVGKRQRIHQSVLTEYGLSSDRLTDDFLSLAQLQALSRHPLITIGAHTHTHPDLRYTTDQELKAELVKSRTLLAEWLGQPIDSLAYPYGDTDQRVFSAARRAGYKTGCIVEHANWRSRLPFFGRLDQVRVDLSTATRRMHRRARKAALRRRP